MKCPRCQIENREEARFCDRCGLQISTTPSEKTSPTLSHEDQLSRIQKYLPRGLAEKVLAQRDKIEGEKRQVTVMFCDMKGFTRFSEKLLPEEVYGIMDQVYAILMRQVHDFGGTVNEMTGDGIMALFGAPVALEEAPQRAIRAGLSIHQEMARLTDTLHKTKDDLPPIRMRIGIHTGPVVVGSLGDDLRVEFKAVGDTVVLAARLEQIAEAGQTYVSRDVFRATVGYFHFEVLEPTKVKGKAEPVQVYRVTGTKETPERSVGIGSPLVGREEELNRLELQIHRLINGTGGIVTITGEAGIGKSRLMAELRRTEMMKRVLLLEGRALSIGRSLSFYPIIDALKQWSRIREEDTDTEAQRKLEKTIRIIHPEEVNEVFPFIATLMGMKLTGKHAERMKGIEGEALEKLIFKNVREIIIKGSELRPTVIYIEDFHWLDTSSLELIEALFRLVEEFKILFILVFRPGYVDTEERILKSIEENYPSHWTKIELEALNEVESGTLLSNLLRIKGLPPHLRDQILLRAGGNPFFLEEVVRSLIDEGAVVLKNGEYQVTEKITQVVIPQSIHALIMTRIDKLDEATRNLVRMASVIGRNFFYRILAEVASNIEEIDRRLDYLKEIQLIRERKRMEELEYLFKHALAQEAAYESILLKRRKELHNKVAQSIEKIFHERLHEFYGMLSYHYSMGEDLDKAEEYMIKAGEEAMKSAASSEALDYFQEALSIYRSKFGEKASPEKIAMLEKNIALALFNRGKYAESIEYFNKTLSFFGVTVPKNPLSIAMKFSAGFFSFLVRIYLLPFLKSKEEPDQRQKEIIMLLYKKINALSIIDAKQFFIQATYLINRIMRFDITKIENGIGIMATFSIIFSWTGLSFALSRRVVSFIKDRVDMSDVKSALYYKFSTLLLSCASGNWPEEIDSEHDLIDKSLRIGEFFFATCIISWNSKLYTARGNFNEAQRAAQKISDIGETYDNEMVKVHRYFTKTYILMKCRKLQETLNEAEEGIQFTRKTGFQLWLIHLYSIKARIQLMLGSVSGSKEALKQAALIKSEMSAAPGQIGEFVLSRFVLDLYQLADAIQQADKTISSLSQSNALQAGKEAVKIGAKLALFNTEALKLMGVYYWLIGKKTKAMKWWVKSIQEGQRLNDRLELSRTYFEMGKRLSEPHSPYRELNGISASEYLNKAKTMFEEMDLQWDLEQLERVMEHVA